MSDVKMMFGKKWTAIDPPNVYIAQPYPVSIIARPRKRKNRRIQKKTIKRFGYKTIYREHLTRGQILFNENIDMYYMTKETWSDVKEYIDKKNREFSESINAGLW